MYSDTFDLLINAIISTNNNMIRISLIERIFNNPEYTANDLSNIMELYYKCLCEYISDVINKNIISDINYLYLFDNNIMRFRVAFKMLYEAYKICDSDTVNRIKSIINNIDVSLFKFVNKYFS